VKNDLLRLIEKLRAKPLICWLQGLKLWQIILRHRNPVLNIIKKFLFIIKQKEESLYCTNRPEKQ